MKVTEIKFFPVKAKDSKIKAFASVTLDKSLCITGIKIIEGGKGTFVSFPSQLGNDNEYHDIVFPVTKEAREGFTKKLLDAYKMSAIAPASDDEDVPFE